MFINFKNLLKSILYCKILFSTFFLFISSDIFANQDNPTLVNHGNVLMYHRFGENKYPSTNINLDQFKQHINILIGNKYNVLGLNEVVQAIKNEIKIPDRSVSITIDDAYLSVYEKAWPLLKKNKIKFTLFVSTDVIDRKLSNYMSWDQIRELMDNGVTIGSQTKSHPHMHRLSNEQQLNEINFSNKKFIKELGFSPKLFAYPYGEYDLRTINIIKNSGFIAAFGQHSGVAHISAGIFQLPRFAMNEKYGSIERLTLSINALPMIVSDLSPINPFINNNPPNFGFTLSKKLNLNKIVRCFASDGITTNTSRVGKRRIEVRLNKPFPRDRGRINCTMDAGQGRWRWFGKQFMIR